MPGDEDDAGCEFLLRCVGLPGSSVGLDGFILCILWFAFTEKKIDFYRVFYGLFKL